MAAWPAALRDVLIDELANRVLPPRLDVRRVLPEQHLVFLKRLRQKFFRKALRRRKKRVLRSNLSGL